jgi:hypothetical protein
METNLPLSGRVYVNLLEGQPFQNPYSWGCHCGRVVDAYINILVETAPVLIISSFKQPQSQIIYCHHTLAWDWSVSMCLGTFIIFTSHLQHPADSSSIFCHRPCLLVWNPYVFTHPIPGCVEGTLTSFPPVDGRSIFHGAPSMPGWPKVRHGWVNKGIAAPGKKTHRPVITMGNNGMYWVFHGI